jgi:hypothetical protein
MINRAKLAKLTKMENELELIERKAERMKANGFHKSAARLLMECTAKRIKINQARNEA